MDDIEAIKREVFKKPSNEPISSGTLPHEIIDIEKMIEETPKIAPLFVKLEKYKEILQSVQRLKVTLKNIQFLLAFKEQIKKIDSETDNMLLKAMQSFSQVTNEFSANFAIPRGVSYIPKPPLEEKVDTSVSDLGTKISKLREELEKIRV